ncbi:hypothetical protein MtrunA17_Chr4g0069371 [Medicago truncatula]|uniref:Uncharacterized protein n=1 Tax=Medicago truncatula TaxID=3880 RepID=A0A396IIG1_MEDTR|nr:hypothetical protein MtrunA17_Chr4g0069371 [Medicago truncatula]
MKLVAITPSSCSSSRRQPWLHFSQNLKVSCQIHHQGLFVTSDQE